VKISQKSDALQFDFHDFHFPLSHFHYDRFDTPTTSSTENFPSISAPTRRATSTTR